MGRGVGRKKRKNHMEKRGLDGWREGVGERGMGRRTWCFCISAREKLWNERVGVVERRRCWSVESVRMSPAAPGILGLCLLGQGRDPWGANREQNQSRNPEQGGRKFRAVGR